MPIFRAEEEVIVIEAGEGSANLRIAEMTRAVEGSDAGREPLTKSEVGRLPGDLVAEAHQAAAYTSDGSLASVGGGFDVHIDVAGHIETDFDGSADRGGDLDDGHSFKISADSVLGFQFDLGL